MALKDNLSRLGKYLEDGVSTVAYKSENILEISKLNLTISSQEKLVDEIYTKIGKKIYKDYKENKVGEKGLIDKCEEIDVLSEDIEKIKKKILKLRDKKICKKCSAEMDKQAEYCPKCGKQQ